MQTEVVADESWCSTPVAETPSHITEVTGIAQISKRKDKTHNFGKEDELPPFTLSKAKQLPKYHLACKGPLWVYVFLDTSASAGHYWIDFSSEPGHQSSRFLLGC